LSETQQFSEKHVDEEYMEEEWLHIYAKNTSDETTINSQLTQPSQTVVALTNTQSDTTLYAANSETPRRTSCSENICTPPTISPNSTASSGVSSSLHPVYSLTKTAKKRKLNNDNSYSDAIKIIADTLKQPIVVKSDFSQDTAANSLSHNASDPVDACMAFIGSILKSINNKVLKLDTMHILVQTVINASTQDL